MIKRISIIGLILLVIGIIGTIFTVKSQLSGEEMLEEKAVDTNDFANIDIKTDNAEIIVLPVEDEKARVELLGNISRYNFSTEVEGDTLNVQVKTKLKKLIHFDIFSKSLSLTVLVPKKEYERIRVQSNNGLIEVTDLEGSEMQLATNNGSVHVKNVKGDTLMLDTDNGRIDMKNVDTKLANVSSNNGRIELENVQGEIIGNTDNGRISLLTEDLDRPIELSTMNGKIDVNSKNKPTNAMLDLKTHNGKIQVFGSSEWDNMIGNGENLIKISTDNGSITITN